MGQAVVDRARRAAEQRRWAEAYDLLGHADGAGLDPDGLALFADCAWWCCRVDEEIELRRRAFTGFAAAGQRRRAAYAAWLLSVRHGLRGEPTAASGWLKRAQRQLTDESEGVEHGYVACGETEQALGQGRIDAAEAMPPAQRASVSASGNRA